jgi:hypothetical protein
MKKLMSIFALNSLLTISATAASYIGSASINVPALVAGTNINDNYKAVATALVNANDKASYVYAKAFVQMHSNKPASIVCRLTPKVEGGTVSNSNFKTVEFAVHMPANQGTNPQPISASPNTMFATSASLPAGYGLVGWRLECRQEVGNPGGNIYVYGLVETTLQ